MNILLITLKILINQSYSLAVYAKQPKVSLFDDVGALAQSAFFFYYVRTFMGFFRGYFCSKFS